LTPSARSRSNSGVRRVMFGLVRSVLEGVTEIRNGRSESHQSREEKPPRKYSAEGPGSAIHPAAGILPAGASNRLSASTSFESRST
jgi:hypothetical protein